MAEKPEFLDPGHGFNDVDFSNRSPEVKVVKVRRMVVRRASGLFNSGACMVNCVKSRTSVLSACSSS